MRGKVGRRQVYLTKTPVSDELTGVFAFLEGLTAVACNRMGPHVAQDHLP